MKVLIIGAAGGLGATFVHDLPLLHTTAEIISWGRQELELTASAREISEKIAQCQPDVIINCAAYNAVDQAEDEANLAYRINGTAVGDIARAAEKCGATLIHYSTNYVFDGTKEEGYHEVDIPSPDSLYGASKLLGEQELQASTSNFYLIRTGWLYGRTGVNGKRSFVDLVLEKAKNKEVLRCINDEWGQPTFYKELVAFTVGLVFRTSFPRGIYHFCNEGRATWYEYAEEIRSIKNLNIEIQPCSRKDLARKAARPQYGILQNKNFYPLPSWKESLKYFLTSPEGVS